MKIMFNSAVAGAGKTTLICKQSADRARDGYNVLIIQPNIKLNEQTREKCEELNDGTFQVHKINSETHPSSVVSAIHEFLDKHNPEFGIILIITLASWMYIRGRNMSSWTLYVDECPQVFFSSRMEIGKSHSLFTRFLTLGKADPHGYAEVKVEHGLKKDFKQFHHDCKSDQGLKVFEQASGHLSRGVKTYVSQSQYNKLISGEGDVVTFYSVITPKLFSGFNSVIIFGANFYDTQFYRIWKTFGVKFIKVGGEAFDNLPDIHSIEVSRNLDIYYIMDDFSITIKNKYRDICVASFKEAVDVIFGNDEFIYAVNGSDDLLMFEGYANAKYVDCNPHGQNQFRSINNVAIYAIFNHSADRVGFLHRKFGIKDGWNLLNFDYVYQIALRGRLRQVPEFGSVYPKQKLIVMDMDVAKYINSKFPGSRIHRFVSSTTSDLPKRRKPGRSPGGLSNAEKVKKSRTLKKSANLDRKLQILQGKINSGPKMSDGICNDITLYRSQNNLEIQENDIKKKRVVCTLMGNVKGQPEAIILFEDWEEFAFELKCLSEKTVPSKNKHFLINTTKFESDQSGIPLGRLLSQVEYSYALWLDIDKGNKCPLEFARLFSEVKMLIYSSYSSSGDDKRWRCVIPFDRPLRNVEYNRIAKDVHAIARQHGHEFDETKKNANDFFYAPCIGISPDDTFFEWFNEGREPLDVDEWLRLT